MNVKRLLLALLLLVSLAAQADNYPSRPLRWVVPFPAGGITDISTRVITQQLSLQLGQPIVVENVPGANGVNGSEAVARAPGDGYTVLTVVAGYAINATLYADRLTFDPLRDLKPVTVVGTSPHVLTVNPSLPVKDVAELIAYARANPGKLNFATSGIGAAAHLATESLRQAAQLDMVHIPFSGAGPAMQAVISGNVQIMLDTPSTLMPQVRAGKLRALATLSRERMEAFPEVPTITQAGGPDLVTGTWVMFLVPARTPDRAIDRLATETWAAMRMPGVKEKLQQNAIEPLGTSPQVAEKFLAAEVIKWRAVIKKAGVRVE